jgi:hypothetical protein
MNHRTVVCHPHKAGRHWTYCAPSFLALAFSSSTAFIIHCSMAATTVRAPTTPVAPSASADDSGHDSGAESAAMTASSLKDRRRRPEGGEWEPIKIPHGNSAYIPKSTRRPCLLSRPRLHSYRKAIGLRNRIRDHNGNTKRC